MFTVFDVHQLAAVAAGDVSDDKVFYRHMFRIVVIVGTAREADADAPVDFAVSAVDMLNHMV